MTRPYTCTDQVLASPHVCHHVQLPSTPGAAERILAAFPSIPRSHLFELPLSPAVSAANDSGRPITLTNPDSAEAKVGHARPLRTSQDCLAASVSPLP